MSEKQTQRHLTILKYLPEAPSSITTVELKNKLEREKKIRKLARSFLFKILPNSTAKKILRKYKIKKYGIPNNR